MIRLQENDVVNYYYQSDYDKDPSRTRSMIVTIARETFIGSESRFFYLRDGKIIDDGNSCIVVFEVFRRDGDTYRKVYDKKDEE